MVRLGLEAALKAGSRQKEGRVNWRSERYKRSLPEPAQSLFYSNSSKDETFLQVQATKRIASMSAVSSLWAGSVGVSTCQVLAVSGTWGPIMQSGSAPILGVLEPVQTCVPIS